MTGGSRCRPHRRRPPEHRGLRRGDREVRPAHPLRREYRERPRARRFWSTATCRILPKPNLVQLSCEDKDPRFVQEMVGLLRATYGNEVFRRVNVSSASEEVRFLERAGRRTAASRRTRRRPRMRDFQEKHQIVDLDTQAKAVVSSVAALNRRSGSRRQMELEYARSFSSPDEAAVAAARVAALGRRRPACATSRRRASRAGRERRPGAGARGTAEPGCSRPRWPCRSSAPSTRSSTATGRSRRPRWSSRSTGSRAPRPPRPGTCRPS